MDTGKRPQSHKKKVGEGSVSVNKTEKVNTGSRPVGSGARPSGGPSRPSGGSGRTVRRAAGGSSTVFMIVVAFLLLRSCMGGGSGGYSGGTAGQSGQSSPQTAIVTQAPTAAPTAAPAATQAPTPVPSNVSASIRDKRYVPHKGDSVTIMVYMCGTDLESNYGMATSDLQEMASAAIGSNVNVIVETGGCRMWKNKIVSNSSNQIYKVESGGVRALETNLGRKPMVDPATLTEFIRYCQTNFPAERNILIFWDHGGGSISGYGYDELYKSSGSMDLAEISKALKDAGCTFDWIGFDACLMATLETAIVCNDYADYLIASEESEPGTGWYYTNWLNMLSKDTAIPTETLAKKLIDDFVNASTAASASAQVSLSIIDLAEMQGVVPPALNSFATSTTAMLSSNNYAAVSNARAGARQFARSSRINQIDLVHFAQRLNTAEGNALAKALLGCVKYNKTNISNANGVSIYFPYESTSAVKTAVSTYNQVGMDAAYTKCISSFASMASSGQLASSAGGFGSSYGGGALDIGSLLNAYLGGGSTSSYSGSGGSSFGGSPLDALLGGGGSYGGQPSAGGFDMNSMAQLIGALAGGRSMPSEMDWFDADVVAENKDYLTANYIDPADLLVQIDPSGRRILTLTDSQWDLIDKLELNVYVRDEGGFLDLGLDNVAEFSDDYMSAYLDWDGTWMTVNGRPAAYYNDGIDEVTGAVTGHIPARLTTTRPAEVPLAGVNGESSQSETVTQLVYLEVVFDEASPDGVITGARPMYEGDTNTVAKGDIQIKPGDTIEFLCDYYTLDGQFESAYRVNEPLTVGAEGLSIEYLKIENTDCSVTWKLTDIYGNHFWLPAWNG